MMESIAAPITVYGQGAIFSTTYGAGENREPFVSIILRGLNTNSVLYTLWPTSVALGYARSTLS